MSCGSRLISQKNYEFNIPTKLSPYLSILLSLPLSLLTLTPLKMSALELELKNAKQELVKRKLSSERALEAVKEDWRREVEALRCLPTQSSASSPTCKREEEHIYDEPPDVRVGYFSAW